MESGDGLLVRVRVRARGGASGIRACDVRALAQLAAEHGNGLLEVTRRARVQVRGVRAESLSALQRAIVELGLAEESAERERSADALIVNPWSGISPACAQLDALAAEMELALAQCGVCNGASDKLAIVLDSDYALTEIAADIHVNLEPQTADRAQIHVASGAGGWSHLGECDAVNVPSIVIALLSALREAQNCKRMRELVETLGLDALRERAGTAELRVPLERVGEKGRTASHEVASTGNLTPRRQRSSEPAFAIHGAAARAASFAPLSDDRPSAIAIHGPTSGEATWIELGLPFGSADRATWDTLALIAERYGSGEVRFTPSRSVLLLGVGPAQRTAALELAKAAGWIIDRSDPLLRVAACPGAPACSSANGETRTLARELASHLGPLETLHVSGCAKGCAQSNAASATLVRGSHDCALGFGLTAAQTALTPRLSLDDARTALAHRAPTSIARTLAHDPSNLQARELRQQ